MTFCQAFSYHLYLWTSMYVAMQWFCAYQSHHISSFDHQGVSDWVIFSQAASSHLLTTRVWVTKLFSLRQHHLWSFDHQAVSDWAIFYQAASSHPLTTRVWVTGLFSFRQPHLILWQPGCESELFSLRQPHLIPSPTECEWQCSASISCKYYAMTNRLWVAVW